MGWTDNGQMDGQRAAVRRAIVKWNDEENGIGKWNDEEKDARRDDENREKQSFFLNSRNALRSIGTSVPAVPSCGLFSFSCDFEGMNRLQVRNDTKQKRKKLWIFLRDLFT